MALEKETVATGVGIIIQLPDERILLHERDLNTSKNPGKIAPFGGHIEPSETAEAAAVRELKEEISIDCDTEQLEYVGRFESHVTAGQFIAMFKLCLAVTHPEQLQVSEGKGVFVANLETVLGQSKVTDFTKEVLITMYKLA